MTAEWTTADYAFIVSLCSAAVSLLALGWNVWSHFIFPKPRVKVTANTAFFDPLNSVAVLAHRNGALPSMWKRDHLEFPSIAVSVVNLGPGAIILNAVVARKSKLVDRSIWGTAMLNPYNNYPSDLSTNGPHSSGIPKKLEIGEHFTAYLALENDWFTEEKFVKFGFVDTIGRNHFCSAADVRALRRYSAKENKADKQ